MPPPEDFTKGFNLEEVIRIFQCIDSTSLSRKIDNDIECLEEYERRIGELERTIASNRAEINKLKQHIIKKQQEINIESNQLLDLVRQSTENENVIKAFETILSLRFERFPTEERDIYKKTSIKKAT